MKFRSHNIHSNIAFRPISTAKCIIIVNVAELRWGLEDVVSGICGLSLKTFPHAYSCVYVCSVHTTCPCLELLSTSLINQTAEFQVLLWYLQSYLISDIPHCTHWQDIHDSSQSSFEPCRHCWPILSCILEKLCLYASCFLKSLFICQAHLDQGKWHLPCVDWPGRLA